MIGLGLDPCQEQPSTPLPAAPAHSIPKPSAMHAVSSAQASRLQRFALPTVLRTVSP